MSRGTLVRILEAFFKQWFLFVLPLVLTIFLGINAALDVQDQYTSRGSVLVDTGGLVTSLSDIPDTGLGSFLTPAQFASQEFDGLLQTDFFLTEVLSNAGVDTFTLLLWADPIAAARASIGTRPTSENLMQVSASSPDGELSQRLVASSIEVFIDFKIRREVASSEESERFYSDLAVGYQQAALDARAEVDAFAANFPIVEVMTANQTTQLARLAEAETLAQATYRAAQDDVDDSRLAALQAATAVREGLSLVDPPGIPNVSDNSLLDIVVAFATYVLIGIVLTLVGPVISAMANRGVLFPDDLAHLRGVAVIGIVPRQARGSLALRHAVVPGAPDELQSTARRSTGLDLPVPSKIGQATRTDPPRHDEADSRSANG
jgi:hypothetical protein